jgi:hypothetical protein
MAVEDSTVKRVIVSPMDYKIKKGDMGVVIAVDRADAEAVSSMQLIESSTESSDSVMKFLEELPEMTASMALFKTPSSRNFSATASRDVSADDVFRHYTNPTGSSWESLYHILSEPVALQTMTITHVNFDHHVILCGSLTGIPDFILKLRSKRLKEIKKVLILYPTPPDYELWATLGSFPGNYSISMTYKYT